MLVDTSYLYFRAFHGVPDSIRTPDGHPVNAVRGVLDFLANLIVDLAPDEVICCWDEDWRPQWRVNLLPSYKTHRVASDDGVVAAEQVPDDLARQVPWVREALEALGFPVIGVPGLEADDVIASLAARDDAATNGAETLVVTGDRDLMQLVDDERRVRVVWVAGGVKKKEVFDAAAVRSKHLVDPSQYVALAALRGDPSDGIAGVRGIGEKTAAQLLDRFGSLDAILAAAADPDAAGLTKSQRERIGDAADHLRAAEKVITVVRDAEIPTGRTDGVRTGDINHEAFDALTRRLGLGGSADRILEALRA